MLSFEPKDISLIDLQAYLQNTVSPRPIAFASTIDQHGNVNLSPFSFFNLFGTNPPTLIFAPNRRVRNGTQKHTYENLLEVKEVVINLVDFTMAEQVSLASCEFEKGVNEFTKAGFTPIKSDLIRPFRVAESKASFECVVKQIIEMGQEGGAANLMICEIVKCHFSEEILDENQKIDFLKTDWVARGGGDYYIRANKDAFFTIPKPNVKIGVGVDQIPENIKKYFTNNELGRLGNIEKIPEESEIQSFYENDIHENFLVKTKNYLAINDLKNAWCSLLNIKI